MGERAERFAVEYQRVSDAFIHLVASLSDEQWRRTGRNYPQRFGDEDEGRPVGVIAHHVAAGQPMILERTLALAEGRPAPPSAAFREENARHAREHAGATREEVLSLLRDQQPRVVAALRGLSDAQLDVAADTPAGRMSVADRIERVLIGHIRAHQGSIEAAAS